jgi:hypothetical protein
MYDLQSCCTCSTVVAQESNVSQTRISSQFQSKPEAPLFIPLQQKLYCTSSNSAQQQMIFVVYTSTLDALAYGMLSEGWLAACGCG